MTKTELTQLSDQIKQTAEYPKSQPLKEISSLLESGEPEEAKRIFQSNQYALRKLLFLRKALDSVDL